VLLSQFLKIREPLVKWVFNSFGWNGWSFFYRFLEGHSEAPDFWRDFISFDFRGVTRKFILGILEGKSFGITNSDQFTILGRGKLRIVPIWRVFKNTIFSQKSCFLGFFGAKNSGPLWVGGRFLRPRGDF